MQDNCNFGVLVCLFVCFLQCLKVNKKGFEHFLDGTVVKTLCFQYRGRGFDPWLGKFHMPGDAAKGKKKRFQWTLSCFQSYAFVANQELLISTLFLLHSSELSSKNPVAAFIIMLSVRLATQPHCFEFCLSYQGEKFL